MKSVYFLSLFLILSTSCTLLNGDQKQSQKTSSLAKKNRQKKQIPSTAPTLVFVHGAHFDSSSWKKVIEILDYPYTLAVDLPGRGDKKDFKKITLQSSANALCNSLKTPIKGSKNFIVILHSQAGAIFHHALGICPNVKIEKAIYLAAVAPQSGEKPFDQLSQEDGDSYFSGVAHVAQDQKLEVGNFENFQKSFAQDATYDQRTILKSIARSEPALIGEGVVKFSKERLKKIKKYYVLTENDLIISASSQAKIKKSWKWDGEWSIESGHLPMLTRPEELVDILEEILF